MARDIVLFNRRLDTTEALSWGLVNRVVANETTYDAAVSLARERFADTDPGIVAMAKGLLTHGAAAPSRTVRHLEFLADMSVLASDALQKGVTSFSAR